MIVLSESTDRALTTIVKASKASAQSLIRQISSPPPKQQ